MRKYILLNLGLSLNFGAVDFEGLAELWPVHMYVDYVRVYQPSSKKNIGPSFLLPLMKILATDPQV